MKTMFVRPRLRPTSGGLSPSTSVLRLAGLLFLASATGALVTAQTGTPHRTVWDGAYTEPQATRGVAFFSLSCGGCHALSPDGRAPLVGDAFWKSFVQKNVGDLLEFVSKYMPNGNPGSLTESVNEDIVAYILKSNGFPAGPTELAPKSSAGVEIIQKEGGTELPANALARVVGCLVRSGQGWAVARATAPEREELVAPAGEDATRPLGNRTIQLKYLLTRLDALTGSRVAVSGILMGAGGADGINVTAVNRVAPKCP